MTSTPDDRLLPDLPALPDDDQRRQLLRLAAAGAGLLAMLTLAMLLGGWLGVALAA